MLIESTELKDYLITIQANSQTVLEDEAENHIDIKERYIQANAVAETLLAIIWWLNDKEKE